MEQMKITSRAQTRGSMHLDAMRGVAAMIVFLNHTRALYFSSFVAHSVGLAVQHQTDNGNRGEITLATAAVVIFFVLSGYLVGGSVLRSLRLERWSWREYLLKRLTRLLVVLIPALVLGCLLDRIGLFLFGPASVYGAPVVQAITVTWHLVDHLRPVVIIGNLFFLQGILVPEAGSNVSLWSLANEFWYYLIFPFLAFALLSRISLPVRFASVAVAAILLAFTGTEIAILFPIWLLGAVVASIPRRISPAKARFYSAPLAAALVGSMLGVRYLHLQKLAAEYLVAMVACMLLYVLVMDSAPAPVSHYHRVTSFFSQMSYSLYMFHLPIAVFLCGLIDSPWRPWPKSIYFLGVWLAEDAGIIVVVFGLWRLFEANTDRLRIRLETSISKRPSAA